MQHFQLVISAFLVAVCVSRVDGNEYTYNKLLEEEKAYTKITMESLAEALNFKVGVHISDTIAHTLVALSKSPKDGGIYYRMPITLIKTIQDMNIASDILIAWVTVCNIVEAGRDLRAQDRAVNVEKLIGNSLEKVYKGSIDEPLKSVFYGLHELISNTMEGDVNEARKIANVLEEHFQDDFRRLNMSKFTKLAVLEQATAQLYWYSHTGLKGLIKDARFRP